MPDRSQLLWLLLLCVSGLLNFIKLLPVCDQRTGEHRSVSSLLPSLLARGAGALRQQGVGGRRLGKPEGSWLKEKVVYTRRQG